MFVSRSYRRRAKLHHPSNSNHMPIPWSLAMPPPASPSVAVTAFVALISAYALGAVTASLLLRGDQQITAHPKNQREERKAAKKKANDTSNKEDKDEAGKGDALSSINFIPIGIISSVYRLCVGTPRQGLLAPNCRGRIELSPALLSADSILGLDGYSHVWVVFVFHLNTNSKIVKKSAEAATEAIGDNANGKNKKKKAKGGSRQFPAKISPPALGGKKVGLFSTRTPHRPNPIGLTLCKIDSISRGKKPYINVSGLDLVDGTPVLDIKPFVPHYDTAIDPESTGSSDIPDGVKLPHWVGMGLEKRREVTFTPDALGQLESIVLNDGTALEFYGPHTGRDSSNEDCLKAIQGAISQVLAIDVRSKWQTGKARKGKFQAERAKRVKEVMNKDNATEDKAGEVDEDDEELLCTQQLDNLLIKYSIRAPKDDGQKDEVTFGSGANDTIEVRAIELLRPVRDNNTRDGRASSTQTPEKQAECNDDSCDNRDNSGPPKEFGALKNYWAERGEAHTPKGLSPSTSAEKIRAEKTGDRAFTFSNRRTLTPPNLTGLSAVGEGNPNET